MIIKDQRIKMMNEILNGIRVLKLYAWEKAFIRSITDVRDKELKYIRKKAIVNTISNILWTSTPILVKIKMFVLFFGTKLCINFVKVGILTFGTYVLSSDKNILTAEKAFVSMALFNLLRGPLLIFPNIFSNVVDVNYEIFHSSYMFSFVFVLKARVSNKRIEKFLNNDEIDKNAVDRTSMKLS